jgi:hypothetical protein
MAQWGASRGRWKEGGPSEKYFGIQVIASYVRVVALKMGVLATRFGGHTYRKH